MKEPYRWNYYIKVKTKNGTFEYEEDLSKIDKIIEEHPDYEEIEAKRRVKCKKKVLKKVEE